MRDLRFALRTLARTPGFSLVVVLALALGIGATTAVFDLLNLFYWRRPPIARPHEVVSVYTTHPQAFIGRYGALSWPDFLDYRAAAETAHLIGYRQSWLSMDAGGGAEPAEIHLVTGDFFETLGIRPALGRAPGREDDLAGAAPVAMMGHATWTRLGSDPDWLGRTVRVGALTLPIVGVAPPGFTGLIAGSDVDLWVAAEPTLDALGPGERTDRKLAGWTVLARLPAGAAAAELEAELTVIARRLDQEHLRPDLPRRITVTPTVMGHPIDQMRIGSTMWILAAAVALLLLIACANVSNLLLARALGRRREMGIRQAIGGSRGRLIRQLLTESLVLALAGGGGGLLLAWALRRLMAGYIGSEIVADMRFDHRVLGLTLAVSFAVTLLFGLAPALVTSRVQLVSALKDAAPSGVGRRRLSGRSLLAVLQVSLALVLLVCCGLLVRDLWQSRSADLGFDTENLLVAGVEVPETMPPAAARELFARLRERAGTIPGVTATATAQFLPPILLDITARLLLPEQPEVVHRSRFNVVDAEYFETLGLQLFEGRLFQAQDDTGGHGVVVVNRVLADELWPGEPALGRTIRLERVRPDDPGNDYEVIGVVDSVTQFALGRAPEPVVYFSTGQRFRQFRELVLRTNGIAPATVFAALRAELLEIDPSLVLQDPQTHDELRWQNLVDQRLRTQTLSVFGVAGLFLALLGVFAVISYSVSQQRREIGIRLAVGARQEDVLRWVLQRGLRLAGAGVAAGLVASYWAVQLLRGAVPGLPPIEPSLYLGAAAFLLFAATASVWLPARRAARVDPLRVLRQS